MTDPDVRYNPAALTAIREMTLDECLEAARPRIKRSIGLAKSARPQDPELIELLTAAIEEIDGAIHAARQPTDSPALDRWESALATTPSLPAAVDAVYAERNRLVAALAHLFSNAAWRGLDPEAPGWTVVYIELPGGQVSWHIPDAEMEQFPALALRDPSNWDGHDTPEKYRRLAALRRGDICRDVAEAVQRAVNQERSATPSSSQAAGLDVADAGTWRAAEAEGHVVDFTDDGYGLQHPPSCRPDLIGCRVNQYLASRGYPEEDPGRYRITLHKGHAEYARLADVSGTTTTDADTGGEE